jgi:hypothetical protein
MSHLDSFKTSSTWALCGAQRFSRFHAGLHNPNNNNYILKHGLYLIFILGRYYNISNTKYLIFTKRVNIVRYYELYHKSRNLGCTRWSYRYLDRSRARY